MGFRVMGSVNNILGKMYTLAKIFQYWAIAPGQKIVLSEQQMQVSGAWYFLQIYRGYITLIYNSYSYFLNFYY